MPSPMCLASEKGFAAHVAPSRGKSPDTRLEIASVLIAPSGMLGEESICGILGALDCSKVGAEGFGDLLEPLDRHDELTVTAHRSLGAS